MNYNDGFFQMPNYLWDLDLDIYQRAILTHIVRKTIGWGKIKDGISLSQFSKDLKISKPKVISTLKELIKMNLIVKKSTFLSNGSQSYNLYYIAEDIVNEINRGSKQDLQGVVNEINTQNTTNTKDTNTKEKKVNKKNFCSRSSETFNQALEISNYLLNKILSINPNFKKPKLETWAKDIDKMLRLDNRSKDEIIAIIDWIYSSAGSFWQPNILSGRKLREKFDILSMQRANSKNKAYSKDLDAKERAKKGIENLRRLGLLKDDDNSPIDTNVLDDDFRGLYDY